MISIIEIVSFAFSLLSLVAATVFFWRKDKAAGFAFLAIFVIAFTAVLHQRVTLSSAVIGLSVERTSPPQAPDVRK